MLHCASGGHAADATPKAFCCSQLLKVQSITGAVRACSDQVAVGPQRDAPRARADPSVDHLSCNVPPPTAVVKATVELQLARVGNPGAAQLVEQEQAEQAAAQAAQTAAIQQQQLLFAQQAMALRPSIQSLPGPPAFGLPLAGAVPMLPGTLSNH